jgi:signal peptidase I
MTPEDRRPDPVHDDELADHFEIDEAAQPRTVGTESPSASAPAQPGGPSSTPGPDGAAEAAPVDVPAPDATPTEAAPPATGNWLQRRRARRARRAAERRKAPWWELPALVVLAILIAILVKTFVVQPFYIPSESMERTLHGCPGCSGDRILVNKPIFDLRDPHPGDIVVFNAPKDWNELGEAVPRPPSNPIVRAVRGFGQLIGFVPPDDLVLVKRVIAVGGQTIKGEQLPNGKDAVMISEHGPAGPWRTLSEPFVDLDGPDDRADFGPVTVPKGRLWVMGDHRNASADSRYHCGSNGGSDASALGSCDPVTSTVPVSAVIGKAFVIAWPPSRWRTLGTPSTFAHAAAGGAVPLGVVLPLFAVRRRRRRRR